MRGIRNAGVNEIDLLGVRPVSAGLEAIHVEAQISFRPVGYISKLPSADAKRMGKVRSSAVKRPPNMLKSCVEEWVQSKFCSTGKIKARDIVWPGLKWRLAFVHGVVRDMAELEMIQSYGVEVIPFSTVLLQLSKTPTLTGAAGTDISEIVSYFARSSGM